MQTILWSSCPEIIKFSDNTFDNPGEACHIGARLISPISLAHDCFSPSRKLHAQWTAPLKARTKENGNKTRQIEFIRRQYLGGRNPRYGRIAVNWAWNASRVRGIGITFCRALCVSLRISRRENKHDWWHHGSLRCCDAFAKSRLI